MNKITNLIKEIIENRKIYRDFKSSICGGVEVIIKDSDVDKIYSLQEYESWSKYGPYQLPVREVKSQVYDWCLKAKGIVRVPFEFRTEFNYESFYFSRKRDAEKFKEHFNLNVI